MKRLIELTAAVLLTSALAFVVYANTHGPDAVVQIDDGHLGRYGHNEYGKTFTHTEDCPRCLQLAYLKRNER